MPASPYYTKDGLKLIPFTTLMTYLSKHFTIPFNKKP